MGFGVLCVGLSAIVEGTSDKPCRFAVYYYLFQIFFDVSMEGEPRLASLRSTRTAALKIN